MTVIGPLLFPIGSVVWLKAGGPGMVITGTPEGDPMETRGWVRCVWFDKNHQRQDGDFHEGWLTDSDPAAAP